MHYSWTRHEGYECSTKGDKRFSAFVARLADGRTVEEHYQCDVKGYDPGGTNWRLGKGRPPKVMLIHGLWTPYLTLWMNWANLWPETFLELRELSKPYGGKLSDRFATTPINQAHALSTLLNMIEP